jgi:anion-transporting  ArsA/GET3 family ATPase
LGLRPTSAGWGSAPPDQPLSEPATAIEAAGALGPDLLGRKLLFVTGKGGTGKTTVTAALAQLAAQRGKRVLACDIDATGGLAAMFEAAPSGFEPTQVAPSISVMSMDTEASLREYLKIQLRIPLAGRIGPLAKVFDFVATAAPGVREILTVGKLCWEVSQGHFDLVVVDAPASGHVVSQLGAPQAMNDLVKVGQIRTQTDWMLDILSDPAQTGVVAVTTPEEMPVSETLELAARIAEETTAQLAAVVVNRVLPELFSTPEEEVFERLREPELSGTISDAVGGDVGPVLEAARLAVTMRRSRAVHLRVLQERLDPRVPVLLVPYIFTRVGGLRSTRQVASSLADELGL